MRRSLPFVRRKAADSISEAPGFTPVRMLEVELGQPLPVIAALDAETGQRYERALALVRLHTRPLGVVDLPLNGLDLSAEDCARHIWRALHAEIAPHLRGDALAAVAGLDAAGIPPCGQPKCIAERERCLADAPFVSVVVATRDRPDSLAACLRSLLALAYPNYEIIVVDNAPRTDATADFVSRTYGGSSRVRYVREDRPGLASAHNRGLVELSDKSEIVAFTDDDVLVDTWWLAEIVRGFGIAEHVGCVTGLIVPAELETPSQLWIEQFGGFSKGFARRIFDLGEHRSDDRLFPYAPGRFGSGANMAFRTSVLREIGGFDPALGTGSTALGGDDLAAFFRVITQGYALVYEPAAIVHHFHHREYAKLRRQVYGYGVGLTAYLTQALLARPDLLLDFATKIPRGAVYALSARSPKNKRKQANYPQELTAIERKGMLYGPLAYLRGHWHTRTLRRRPPGPRAAAATLSAALGKELSSQ